MIRYLLILSVSLFIPLLNAQEVVLSPAVISSAGGYAETGNISLSWTLGELAVTTVNGESMMLTQGFQQGDLESVGFSLDPIEWQIIAYPNPVVSALNIQFDLLEPGDFHIEIQDITGRLMRLEDYDKIYPGDVVQFDMSGFKPGSYFYRISSKDRQQVRVISIRKY